MYVISVEFVAVAAHRESLRAALLEQARNSLEREADCHTFHVCAGENDPDRFFLYEEYTDRAAFEAHLESEHFIAFNARTAEWVASRQVDGWERL